MSIRDLGYILNEEINVIVLSKEGRLLDMYDGKNSIMDEFLDREIDKIIKVTFNTIWVKIC